jgi:uncharacterized protein (TIGR03084 family)
MVTIADLLADLADESTELDALVAPLPDAGWARPTPATGWSIAHQIAHLAWTDRAALVAVTDTGEFFARVAAMAREPETIVNRGAEEFLAAPQTLLARWRGGRNALHDALAALPPGARVPWFAGPMSAASMATARLMETWAHGLDVAEALGRQPVPTERLRHIAHLGARTVANSFESHGREAPAVPVRIELVGPDGDRWVFGPVDAENRVVGPALDFCLLVTQRRHRADLALAATGPVADEWLDIAQAFAGPPGTGRTPAER